MTHIDKLKTFLYIRRQFDTFSRIALEVFLSDSLGCWSDDNEPFSKFWLAWDVLACGNALPRQIFG